MSLLNTGIKIDLHMESLLGAAGAAAPAGLTAASMDLR
jgi:hypothetical protein